MRRLSKDEAEARIARDHAGRCTMCMLADGAPRLSENAAAVAVLARYATRPGHVLVVLREHHELVESLPVETWTALCRLAWEAARALAVVVRPVRTYVAALGAPSGLATTFPHLHQHVVPLSDGGEADRPAEVFTWRNGVLVYDDGEARALEAQIRAAWPPAP